MKAAVTDDTDPSYVSVTARDIDMAGRRYFVIALDRSVITKLTVTDWAVSLARNQKLVIFLDLEGRIGQFDDVLSNAVVGDRFILAGDEFNIMTAVRMARFAGVVTSELYVQITGRRLIRVFCAHCAHYSVVNASPGAIFSCGECRQQLFIHRHTSTLHGAYLASVA